MTENNLNKTDVTISAAADSCTKATLELGSKIQFDTNTSLTVPNQLRANAGPKEVSVRITSKSRVLKLNDINSSA